MLNALFAQRNLEPSKSKGKQSIHLLVLSNTDPLDCVLLETPRGAKAEQRSVLNHHPVGLQKHDSAPDINRSIAL